MARDVQFERLGALAERYFKDDPKYCPINLRQFRETLAQLTVAKAKPFASVIGIFPIVQPWLR